MRTSIWNRTRKMIALLTTTTVITATTATTAACDSEYYVLRAEAQNASSTSNASSASSAHIVLTYNGTDIINRDVDLPYQFRSVNRPRTAALIATMGKPISGGISCTITKVIGSDKLTMATDNGNEKVTCKID